MSGEPGLSRVARAHVASVTAAPSPLGILASRGRVYRPRQWSACNRHYGTIDDLNFFSPRSDGFDELVAKISHYNRWRRELIADNKIDEDQSIA